MAAPEGSSVLVIPKRYLVAGALALCINAGVPPADVVREEPVASTRQVMVVPKYSPPPLLHFVHPGQVEAPAAVEDPTPGQFVRTQIIPPYLGPNWVTTPQLADVVVGIIPEADQHLDIPIYRQRLNTNFVASGVPPAAIVAPSDELLASRRSIVQPPYPKYYGQGFVTNKSSDITADNPAEQGAIVVALPPYYAKPSLTQFGRVPPPDVAPVFPINDRIRLVSANYPYNGQSFAHTTPHFLVEQPAEYGTILIPNPAMSWPNYAKNSWIQRQGPPTTTVVVPQDEEAWVSRRSIVVPTRPYNAGQFALAKVPPADVVTPQDEVAWVSRRSINLKDYSSLWANPALTRAFVKQIEEDLSLRPGNYAIVIPTQPYQPGQVQYGYIPRPAVVLPGDEILASRRVVSLAEWRQKYFAGNSFQWVPRPDNLITPITFACISVEEGPVTLCSVTEGPVTIITVEVEC